MNLTFRQLRVFESVARNLNFTQAAKELFLSQPAVSMQVKQLEEQTGMPLVEKIGKKLYLTAVGIEVYEYARTTLQQQRDLEETIEQLKDLQVGHLKIAVASTANHFVIRLLASFLKKYPKVNISLDVTNRVSLLNQLENNECDLVIMGRPPGDYQLNAFKFLENPLVLIAAPDHRLAAMDKVPLSELANEKFVVREQGSGTRSAAERFFEEHGIPFNTTLDMSNNRAIKHAVEEGLGLGIVSLHTLEIELKAQSLKVLDVQDFPIYRHWYVVEREGKRLSPIAIVFKEYLMQRAKNALGELSESTL